MIYKKLGRLNTLVARRSPALNLNREGVKVISIQVAKLSIGGSAFHIPLKVQNNKPPNNRDSHARISTDSLDSSLSCRLRIVSISPLLAPTSRTTDKTRTSSITSAKPQMTTVRHGTTGARAHLLGVSLPVDRVHSPSRRRVPISGK